MSHNANRDTLLAIKLSGESKYVNDRLLQDRQRDCLILISSYLRSKGYSGTVTKLHEEAGLAIFDKYEAADNIDIYSIIVEFMEYREMKFGCKPKLTRLFQHTTKNDANRSEVSMRKQSKKYKHGAAMKMKHQISSYQCESKMEKKNRMNLMKSVCGGNESVSRISVENNVVQNDMDIVGNSFNSSTVKGKTLVNEGLETNDSFHSTHATRLLKPLPSFGDDSDIRNLAAGIQREVVHEPQSILWEDIIGLENAKRTIKEAIVFPVKYPRLFTRIFTPWRGLLLFGPPGTGKTMLAKAAASQCNSTFFNMSSSSLVSKYRGDSEKLVKILFDLARYHAPSTIFFDEIDSIMSHRGGHATEGSSMVVSEHEGSRRMKTELLVQMDGLASYNEKNKSSLIFVIAASNMPWDLDHALLRRLEKRAFIPLPKLDARLSMLNKSFEAFSGRCDFSNDDILECGKRMTGYSGADISAFYKEVTMKPIRRLIKEIEKLEKDSRSGRMDKCNNGSQTISNDLLDKLIDRSLVISKEDLLSSLEDTKSTSGSIDLLRKYEKWMENYGTV